jgi:paraquat-inducible protein B
MSKQANPTLIGAFVVAAATLAIAVVLILGGGRLWTKTRHFVVVFEGSLHGLSIGAPVTFRGVPLGEVVDITPVVVMEGEQPAGLDVLVTLALQRGRLRTSTGEFVEVQHYSDADVAALYDRIGVRAQLALQSVLTGQLYVDLDFFPGSPVRKVDVKTPYPQLATIETGLKKLGKAIENLPIDQLAQRALRVLESIEQRVNSPELDRILDSGADAAGALKDALQRIDAEVDPLVTSLRQAADATTGAMRQAEETLDLEQSPAGRMVAEFTRAAESADQALREIRKASSEASEILDDRSAVRRRMQDMLDEVTAAARSLRLLADYLERHPEALLQGKARTR